MKRFAVRISIRATPARIWSLLTDARGYTRWNTTVEKVEGTIAPGGRVSVYPKINPRRAFPVDVVEFQTPRRMVWRGGMPLGLFAGERLFTLAPESNGTVGFSMSEEYRGLLAPLICRSIPDLQPAFDQFAADLKRAAEASE